VDVGLKVSNPEWRALGLQPVEVAGRPLLGPVVAADVDAVLEAVRQCAGPGGLVTDEVVSSFLYGHPGQCADRAAAELQQLLNGH